MQLAGEAAFTRQVDLFTILAGDFIDMMRA